MRKVIARRLQESKTFIPHFYVVQEVRADKLADLAHQLKVMDSKSLSTTSSCVPQLLPSRSIRRSTPASTLALTRLSASRRSTSPLPQCFDGLITPIVRHADCKSIANLRRGESSREKSARGETLP